MSPPVEAVVRLYALASQGEIVGLREEVEEIAQMGASFGPFVEEIRKLASGFQMEEVCAFLKLYLEE